MIRSASTLSLICAGILLFTGRSMAQSSVDQLMNASDAGQQVFDHGNGVLLVQTGKIFKRKEVDTKPVFPGGDKALNDQLSDPALCGVLPKMEDCFGMSKMKFDLVVNPDGKVSDVEFSKEGCTVLQPYVLCAIRGLSMWKPAMKNGIPVRCRLRTSVTYDLR